MFKEKRLLFLIAETPLHPGSGSEVGIVDLPIQREKHTEFPKIESSTLKGCIREAIESRDKQISLSNNQQIRPKDKIKYKVDNVEKETDYVSLVFGPEGEETHAGALTLTDARILLFPVKSLKGVFAWITCPMVLERFKRDLKMVGVDPNQIMNNDFSELLKKIPPVKIPPGSTLTVNNNAVLEEYTFGVEEEEKTGELAKWFADNIFPEDNAYSFWKGKLEKDLVILSDDDFTQFVKTSTEIITRTKIDNVTGTVQSGALWTEEYLPQDTIMYSLAMFTPLRVENDEQKGILKANTPEEEAKLVAEFFKEGLPEVIQIGGNQTIGKGFVILNLK